MNRPPDLDRLAAFSARIGGDPMLVQASGGNTSLKHDGVLWVKASGTWLAQAEREQIFVPVSIGGVRAAMAADEPDPVSAHVLPGAGLRPSIETTFHACLDHRIVVHVHSIHTLSFAVRRAGAAEIAARLQGLDWRWVPYRRPGLPLTRAIMALGEPAVPVIVLANHGLIVGAETIAAAEDLLWDVERRLAVDAGDMPPPDLPWLEQLASETGLALPPDRRLHDLAMDPLRCRHALAGPLFPDQVVFLGPDIATAPATNRALAALPGRGVLVRPAMTAGQRDMALGLALLLPRLAPDADIVPLDPAEVAGLMHWEAEQYRIRIDAAQR